MNIKKLTASDLTLNNYEDITMLLIKINELIDQLEKTDTKASCG